MKVQKGTWQLEDGQFVGNECAWPSNGAIHGCKQRHVNEFVVEMARSLNSPLLLTLDAHFVKPETKMVQDILLQNGNKNGWRASSAYYQMDTEQAWSAWSKNHGATHGFAQIFQEAVENNSRFAEMIDKIEIEKKYHLPEVEFPPEIRGTNDEKLLALLMKRIRLHDRMPKDPELAEIYLARLQREIAVIAYNGKINFLPYFLIIDTKICSFVRQRGHLMGPGRGSAAGCLLSYLLKITHIDPIVWNLSFERFLSLGRINRGKFPDIDLDFGDPKIVVDYLAAEYQEKFARICTTGTAKLKGAIRDVSRIILKTGENPALAQIVNDLCETIENTPQGADIHKWLYGHEDNEGSHPGYIETNTDLLSFFGSFPQVKEMVDQVLDVPRSVGRHASAYCISDEPIHSIVPMCKIKGEDCTQFTMGPVESLGLIKMDFLGLNTLNDIQGAIEIIKRRRNINIDIYSMETEARQVINSGDTIGININDPAVFKMFCDGETATVFQFKTAVATPLCRDIKPKNLHDLASITANGRPGTMYALMEDGKTTLIDEWKDRRMGLKKVTFLHPDLEPILRSTDGIYCMSLDSTIHDPETGGRIALSDFKKKKTVQSIDSQNGICNGSVIEWVDSGMQDSIQVSLEDGRSLRVTHTTQFLTEFGWKRVSDLTENDYIAIPSRLSPGTSSMSRDRLRILAYLVAEGHLGGSGVEFINSDERLLSAYENSVKKEFGLLTNRRKGRSPGTWRIYSSCGTSGRFAKNRLIEWLRSMGLKTKTGSKKGGARSHEKSIPEEVFSLCPDDLAFFIACYWDCDGSVDQYSWCAKTISRKLADDTQQLLDRLGIQSWIALSEEYESVRGSRKAWGVHVWTPEKMKAVIEPHCLIKKWNFVVSPFCSSETVCRKTFVEEVKLALAQAGLPLKRGCLSIGIDPQHCLPGKICNIPRIPVEIAKRALRFVDLPKTKASSKLRWRKILSIKKLGREQMADLSISVHHNFIANGIVVHNTFQEQIMASFVKCCGYSEEKADEIREIIGKKKADVMAKLLPEIRERLAARQWSGDQIDSFISLCVAASSYSFNACLALESVLDTPGGQKTLGDIQIGDQVLAHDVKNKNPHYVDVLNVFESEAELWEVQLEDGSVLQTSMKHKYLCEDGVQHPLWEILEKELRVVTQ